MTRSTSGVFKGCPLRRGGDGRPGGNVGLRLLRYARNDNMELGQKQQLGAGAEGRGRLPPPLIFEIASPSARNDNSLSTSYHFIMKQAGFTPFFAVFLFQNETKWAFFAFGTGFAYKWA